MDSCFEDQQTRKWAKGCPGNNEWELEKDQAGQKTAGKGDKGVPLARKGRRFHHHISHCNSSYSD